jgi:Rrf2 family protein
LSMQTNAGVVRRLLSKLSHAGLVKTQRGQGGGSDLARPPKKITISDIYMALGNEPIFRTFEKKPYKHCPVSCGIRSALDVLYDEFEQALFKDMKKKTLADVLDKIG